ncbi:MAG: phosphatidate cytidylyltransferase [Tidjanibacter sp.]|nr:phosphatidate cytidylyltransferase [Tidjanibacter sp.]
MSLRGKNIGVRTLSGAVLAVVVIGSAVWSPWAFMAVVGLIAIGGMMEFFRLVRRREGIEPQEIAAIALGAALVIETALTRNPLSLLTVVFIFPIFFVIELFRAKPHPLENIAASICAVVYVALPMALLQLIGRMPSGEEWNYNKIVAIILLVWINDIFAYLVGCSIGRHRLCERLSPKKSWEGFIGGVVCSVGAAVGFGAILNENLWLWAGLGATVVVGGVAGDLVESMFKREVDVKDSGNIIPGHGGFLDRFDAMFLAIPAAYLYLILFNI